MYSLQKCDRRRVTARRRCLRMHSICCKIFFFKDQFSPEIYALSHRISHNISKMSDVQHILCGKTAAAVQPSGGGVRECAVYTPRHVGARMNFNYHLMNCIIGFDIIHPICQTSSVFSAEMRPPPCDRAEARSEDA